MPEASSTKPAEISTSFASGAADSVTILIKSVFYGLEADVCRQMVTWVGTESISLECLLEVQEQWGEAL